MRPFRFFKTGGREIFEAQAQPAEIEPAEADIVSEWLIYAGLGEHIRYEAVSSRWYVGGQWFRASLWAGIWTLNIGPSVWVHLNGARADEEIAAIIRRAVMRNSTREQIRELREVLS